MNLTVFAFVNAQLGPGVTRRKLQHANLCRSTAFRHAVMRGHRQRLTVSSHRSRRRQIHTFFEPSDHHRRQLFSELGVIDLWDTSAGMHQRVRQLSIVRQQQHSFGVVVEPSHRKQSHRRIGNQIKHRLTAIGIRRGRDVAFRLVQQVIGQRLLFDQLAIDADPIGRWIDARTKLRHDTAIDSDVTLTDQHLRVSTRSNASFGEEEL